MDFAWIFFRAEGLGTALDMLRHALTDLRPFALLDAIRFQDMGLDLPDFWALCLFLLALLGVDMAKYRGISFQKWFAEQNWLFRELMLAGLMLLVFIFGIWGNGFDASSFIYFQF